MTGDYLRDVPPEFPEVQERTGMLEVLPDGHEALVLGEGEAGFAEVHLPGDNPLGLRHTAGLVACEAVLKRFGNEVSEADLATIAVEEGLYVAAARLGDQGGATTSDYRRLLARFDIPSREEAGRTIGELAAYLEEGKGVVLAVNAGLLRDDPAAFESGLPNDLVVPVAVACDPVRGEVRGVFIADSIAGERRRFVPATTLHSAWEALGGMLVVTDVALP